MAFLVIRFLATTYAIKMHFFVHIFMNSSLGEMDILSVHEFLYKAVSNATITFVIDVANGIADLFLALMIVSL